MSYAQITMKSGAVVEFETSYIKTEKNNEGRFVGLEWDKPGGRELVAMSLGEIAAVVFIDTTTGGDAS